MEFQLTRELIDQIMFGMENQDTEFVLDTEEPRVIKIQEISDQPDGTEEPDDRYIPLPEWRSVDGYNLMEKFVASLHNPIYREILRRILASGKGVFRQFKDALKEKKEIERLWYHFKEREMRSRVVEWYNLLRESWGLAHVGDPEGDETDALVLTDFTFSLTDPGEQVEISTESESVAPPESNTTSDVVLHFDEIGFMECMAEQPAHIVRFLLDRRRRLLTLPDAPTARILVARTPVNELAGFLWADLSELPDGRIVSCLNQIYVLPEFRGLGLARTLFTRFCSFAYEQKAETLLIEVPGAAAFLLGMFEAEGASPHSQLLQLDITDWYRENVELPV